jgi:uncharacterized protein (DUF1697 family)
MAMAVWIALYRGINVVGRHAVRMEALRALHEELGHNRVASYIQSGNVLFSAPGTADRIARALAAAFADAFGFEARVLVRSAQRLSQIVAENPYSRFADENPRSVHVGFCDGDPRSENLQTLLARFPSRDEFVTRRDIVYFHAPDGFGTSKFAAGMERSAGVPMTVRNWRTVETLHQMAGTLR